MIVYWMGGEKNGKNDKTDKNVKLIIDWTLELDFLLLNREKTNENQ